MLACNGDRSCRTSLPRSKSLPGVAGPGGIWEDNPTKSGTRDSGVVVLGSEQASFGSDPRSSLLCGELHSGLVMSEAVFSEHERRAEETKKATIDMHYYPEGGWGWVVLCMNLLVTVSSQGLHQSVGIFISVVLKQFEEIATLQSASWLGAVSTSIALLISPVTIAICRKKSTRVTAVLGGLVAALGCLFTSFASQYHQLFISYGTFVGIGVGMTRDSSTLMVGQYFKRRREFVEIIVVSGSGLGISFMSVFIREAINSLGWTRGLQAVSAVVFLTFIMGTFYRSATLYHPQRRAILHLKNQKRKIKEKNKLSEKSPFFDVTTLRSKTVQILLVSIGLSSFGITTPIIYLATQAEQQGIENNSILLLQTYLGLGWVTGCCVFGFLIVQKNAECKVGRQYLCQLSMFVCGIATLAFTAVENYHGYVMFAWVYGIFSGGFHYSLKMYTYEKVRARNFAKTWGFVQCSQALPIAIGVPITGYINIGFGNKAGYYFSSTLIIFGSMTIFLIDIHRRNAARHKHEKKQGGHHTCVKETCPESKRKDSLANLDAEANALSPLGFLHQRTAPFVEGQGEGRKPELTCISEEGIADMDLPDHFLEDLALMGDITSCDKVENYLIMSEYENNLVKADMPLFTHEKKGKRRGWSFKPQVSVSATDCYDLHGGESGHQTTLSEFNSRKEGLCGEPSTASSDVKKTNKEQNSSGVQSRQRLSTSLRSNIPVIEEASV